MNIEQHKLSVKQCFKNYEDVQKSHIKMLENDKTPDINSMARSRENAFLNLKTALDKLVEYVELVNDTKSLPALREFESRVVSIMNIDKKIGTRIKKYKKELKTNLNQIKKGKMVMNGYRHAGLNQNRPHVLSMNR